MDFVMQWVTDNYKILAAVAAGIALLWPMGGKAISWILPKLKGLKTKGLPSLSVDVVDFEDEDLRCIAHLRDRAAILGNDQLIKEVKNVYSQFFDIHVSSTRGKSKPTIG